MENAVTQKLNESIKLLESHLQKVEDSEKLCILYVVKTNISNLENTQNTIAASSTLLDSMRKIDFNTIRSHSIVYIVSARTLGIKEKLRDLESTTVLYKKAENINKQKQESLRLRSEREKFNSEMTKCKEQAQENYRKGIKKIFSK